MSYDSPETSFPLPKISAILQPGHPLRGRQIEKGVGSYWRFSTNISLYLKNGAKQGYGYYGTRIGTRTHSFEWRYFQ